MNKREKIIIFLAVSALLYGIFDYFVFSSLKNSSDEAIQSETTKNNLAVLTTLDGKLASLQIMAKNQNKDSYLISMIESEWKNDPFLKLKKAPEKFVDKSMESAATIDVLELNYSGFIQYDKRIFAVINGMEYVAGEYIKDTEYQIVRITSNKIVLTIDKNRQTVLFLKEE